MDQPNMKILVIFRLFVIIVWASYILRRIVLKLPATMVDYVLFAVAILSVTLLFVFEGRKRK